MNVLCNPAAEKAVLSACYNGGLDVFFEVSDIVKPSSFVEPNNEIFFSCLRHVYEHIKVHKCDLLSLQAAAIELGIEQLINKTEVSKHIRQIIDFSVELNNARKFAQKIRKLEIARLLYKQLERANEHILEVTGTETVNEILGIAEEAIFDFSSLLSDQGDDPKPITAGLIAHLQQLIDQPVQQPGISTGFPIWDATIGGGLRGGTVNIIGARAKGFKSGMALNMGRNISSLGLPVLYLDTEMQIKDQQSRLIASYSRTQIRDIETGQFSQTNAVTAHVLECARELDVKCQTFTYKNISGMALDEQLSIMRRWLFKIVGVNTDKKANPCVILYDYIKLMDAQGLQKIQEYQAIGFLLTRLHNFTVLYDIPIVGFVQLNRDGIDKESVASVSQSDRIIWFGSNFSILKPKSDEEIANDGVQYGNFKLAPMVCRHGPGLPPNEYIACKAQKNCAHIEELTDSISIRSLNRVGTSN